MSEALYATERHPATFTVASADGARPAQPLVSGVRDTARVDVENWHSVRYWSETMGVSQTQLLRAIRVVGTLVVRVEAHFAGKQLARRPRRGSSAE